MAGVVKVSVGRGSHMMGFEMLTQIKHNYVPAADRLTEITTVLSTELEGK